jgi:metallophosphoesterase (TIGR00282 family)
MDASISIPGSGNSGREPVHFGGLRGNFVRLLFIGDIVGQPGCLALESHLPAILRKYEPDLVVANGENVAGGRGITRQLAEHLFDLGIEFLTMGNHVWDNKEIFEFIQEERRIVRPANYPPGVPGFGYTICDMGGYGVAIVNLMGRAFMGDFDNPFSVIDQILEEIAGRASVIFVDFHAESTSEKQALAWYLDGRVSVVAGTHTHVQTADERILPRGTAYISDVGMVGPYDGVIGVSREQAIRRFRTLLPTRLDVEKGRIQFHSIVVDIHEKTGKALSIERIRIIPDFPDYHK